MYFRTWKEVFDLWLDVNSLLVQGVLHSLLHASGLWLHRQVLNEIDTGVCFTDGIEHVLSEEAALFFFIFVYWVSFLLHRGVPANEE